jgi:hypothetical protein
MKLSELARRIEEIQETYPDQDPEVTVAGLGDPATEAQLWNVIATARMGTIRVIIAYDV